MGLLPSTPDVEVFAPTIWFVGQDAVIEVDVIAKQETKVDFIDVRGTGKQGWEIGGGDSRTATHTSFPQLAARVMGPGTLPAGKTRYGARFKLPAGTAPSHQLAPAWAHFEIFVHVSVPWWLDGKYRFHVPVRVPPPSRVTRTPVAIRSAAPPGKPRLEISLASARLIAGETLVGSCAVYHVDDRKPREVDIMLVPVVRLHGTRVRERRASTYNISITLPAGSAGTNIPFQFRLPDTMTPSFTTVTHELRWFLVASYGSFFGGKEEVSIPLEIVDASAAASTARLHVAPRLADQRVIAAFDQFARGAGWTVAAGDDDASPYVTRAHDGSELGIGYSYRGKDGTFLLARVAHASLGLALSVTPSSSLRHMFFRDIEIDLAAWDRAHLVAARSAEQAIPFLRAMAPATLDAIRAIGPLVRWDDDALLFERPIVSVEEPDVRKVASALAQLATALAAARGQITTPPGLAVDEAAFAELAGRWRGRFTPGDLSIEGTLDNAPLDVALQWDEDGKPYCVRASIGSPHEASEEARKVSLSMPRPVGDALAASTPEALVDKLVAWPADFRDLHVHDGVASASLVLSESRVEATRVRELVEALRVVLAAIEPAKTPYR